MVQRPKKSHSSHFIIAMIVIFVLGLVVYDLSAQKASAVDAVTTDVPLDPNDPANDPALAVLNTIQSITLDESIFTNPAFLSLQDRTVIIAPQPVGRTNPFAPFGSSASTQTKTTR